MLLPPRWPLSGALWEAGIKPPNKTMHKAHIIDLTAAPVIQDRPASTVSSRYSFVPTNEIVAGLERSGWGFDHGTARVCRKAERRPFAHHVLRFSNPNLPTLPDGTRPQAVVVNSHGGSGSFQISLGAFRIACANGLVIQSLNCGAIRLPHVGLEFSEILGAADALLGRAPEVFARVGEWSRIILDRDQAVELAHAAIRLRWDPLTHKVDVDDVLQARRTEDVGSDLWRTFNRIQESVVRGDVRVRRLFPDGTCSDARRAPALRGPVQQVSINRSLWATAEAIALN